MKEKIVKIITTHFPSTYAHIYSMDECTNEICQMMADELALNMWACNLHKDSIKFSLDSSGFTPEQIDNALNKVK